MKKKEIKIESYEDACAYNGEEPMNEKALMELGITAKQIAGLKLEKITLALNKGKVTDIYNGKPRWFPYFWTNGSPSSFAFGASYCGNACAYAGSGSRLSYFEEEVSDYSGEQFIELWKEYLS